MPLIAGRLWNHLRCQHTVHTWRNAMHTQPFTPPPPILSARFSSDLVRGVLGWLSKEERTFWLSRANRHGEADTQKDYHTPWCGLFVPLGWPDLIRGQHETQKSKHSVLQTSSSRITGLCPWVYLVGLCSKISILPLKLGILPPS